MSYILDALRKSQQQRHPGGTPRPATVHNVSLALPVNGWWLALGAVLLLAIGVAAFIFWRGTLARLPEPPAPAANAPVAAAPKPEPPAVVEPPPTTPPALPVEKTTAGDLAEQGRLPAPAPRSKKIASARAAIKTAKTARRTEPASPAVPLVTDDTPLLQQMPESFQRALPPLALTIHVYSHDKSQRILFINNREYHEGGELDGGIRVETIVPDGVVLSYAGERFKLSRPR